MIYASIKQDNICISTCLMWNCLNYDYTWKSSLVKLILRFNTCILSGDSK